MKEYRQSFVKDTSDSTEHSTMKQYHLSFIKETSESTELSTMKQYRLSFLKDTSNSAEHALLSAQVLQALSPRCSKSVPLHFGRAKPLFWGQLDCRLGSIFELHEIPLQNCAMKSTQKSPENLRESQMSPGDVENKDKDTEVPDQPSPRLLRESSRTWALRWWRLP